METICDACRAIDFGKVLTIPPDEIHNTHDPFSLNSDKPSDALLDEDANRFDSSPTTSNCPLCSLLSASLCPTEDEWSDPGIRFASSQDPWVLKAFSFRRNCRWVPDGPEVVPDCHVLLTIRQGGFSSSGDYSRHIGGDGFVVCLPKEREERCYIPRVLSETFDVKKANSWLDHCRRAHGAPCNEGAAIVPGMHVIDCESLVIVPAEQEMRWVVLSYTWGHAKSYVDSESTKSSAPLDEISRPRTVQDAIQVTKDLGYKYLWIDRYCIDQSDETYKQSQLKRMDAIYNGADLTIVAAAGQDDTYGLPGVGAPRRKKQQIVELDSCTLLSTGPDPIYEAERSKWWSRGWMFQEGLLSRRRPVFTEHQSFFECGGGCCMEALGGLELCSNDTDNNNNTPDELRTQRTSKVSASLHGNLVLHARLRMEYHNTLPQATAIFDQFFVVAREYTRRNLTFDSDSLTAFAGISHHLRVSEPKVSHMLGIPYVPSLLEPESEDSYTIYSLCWSHRGEAAPRRRARFPSWTWAGWAGEVHWTTGKLTGGGRDFIPKMRQIQIEEEDGQVTSFEEYLRAFDPSNTTMSESSLALRFEAKVVPSSLFAMKDAFESNALEESSSEDSDEAGASDFNKRSSVCSSSSARDDPEGQENGTDALDDARPSHESRTDEGHEEPGNHLPAADSYSPRSSNGEEDSTTISEQLDPHDWVNWKVGSHGLWDRCRPPECDPLEFLEKLQDDRWCCLLLGDYDGNAGYSHRRFILVIEWLEDGSARRVGSVALNSHYYLDSDEPRFFDDTNLTWTSVRLI
ncbi:heterokaryon incompatibility protein-domain-containing protein [Astrocystis sublimbata]|nr:heterokaryon incompatibility protein-domain-containing protein [Astrocystis sublimbata]